MKNPIVVFALLASTLAGVQAQVTGTGATTTAKQPALPAPTAFSAVSRDGGSTVWERTVYERGTNGTIVSRESRYTELCSGLNFYDSNTKQWTPSRETIDLLPAGGAFAAAATSGQHKARFPLDIAQGVIQLSTPEGKQLTSRPVGLFFEDDNNSVLIAILTNSVGELAGSNQVVYPNAFEGAAASVRYRYTKFGFEQDIVIQGQLPDPRAVGLNPARTRLGVLTAFFDTNNPVATAGPVDAADGLSDTTLTFGNMKMGQGRAFSIGNTEQTPPPGNMTPATWLNWITNAAQQASSKGTPTYKRWFQLNGRNFLMEEVPYRRVATQLRQLPPTTGRLDTISTNLLAGNSFLDAIPARLLSPSASGAPDGTRTMRLSRMDLDQTRAVVLDYETVPEWGYDYTLKGDTTYYVSGPCYFGNVTLGGGAVIKYANVNSFPWPWTQLGWWNATAFMSVWGTLTCQTSSYHPVVFTAVDDNTVGEPIPYPVSSGNPPAGNCYANPAIFSPINSVTLSNVCIRYADLGVMVGDGCNITVSDSQVIDSYMMALLGMYDEDTCPMTLTCNNCLYDGLPYYGASGILVLDLGNGSDSYFLNNCTIANLYCLGGALNPNFGYVFNSVFANINSIGNISWQGGYNGFYNCQDQMCMCNPFTIGSNPFITYGYPFQTAGGGKYYLADDTFRGQGYPGVVSPSLLADLQTKTTYPPVVHDAEQIYSDSFTAHVQRDNVTPGPDLGYHYDPLDYIFHNCQAYSYSMTFPAGTAVGWQGQGLISESSTHYYSFNGTVVNPCYFVRCNTVQEADNSSDSSNDGTGIAGAGQSPEIKATFTRFSALGDRAAFFDGNGVNADSIENCEFWGGLIGGDTISKMNFTCYNCLFDRSFINLSMTASSQSSGLQLQNCTLHGGNLVLCDQYNPSHLGANAYDCAFDGTTLAVNNPYGGNSFSFRNNAYLSGATQLPNDQHDVTVSGSFNWQSGPLGNYYLPIGSPLIDANNQQGDQQASQIHVIVNGATGAQELLSDFTTQTSQQVDSGAVDIGYHYTSLYLGPMDVVFILDNTGSMGYMENGSMLVYQNAIINALNYIAYIEGSSFANNRFALITPDTDNDKNPVTGANDFSGHDMVVVRVPFTSDLTSFKAAVSDPNMIAMNPNNNTSESSDECLNTVVNSRAAAGRQDVNSCAPSGKVLQVGDFCGPNGTSAWRGNARKLVVVITDAGPGGFCDGNVQGYYTYADAHQYAHDASTNGIKINAIEIGPAPLQGFPDYAQPVMQDYSTTTCGWYEQLNYGAGSSDIEIAILNMLCTAGACNN